jgi:hypothetical protein
MLRKMDIAGEKSPYHKEPGSFAKDGLQTSGGLSPGKSDYRTNTRLVLYLSGKRVNRDLTDVSEKSHCISRQRNRRCRREVILVIQRRLRRPQRRGSEIHAEPFAPYGHGAVFRQVQVAAKAVVLVADVSLHLT